MATACQAAPSWNAATQVRRAWHGLSLQVFWRGFFLTALTRVLPPAAAIGVSTAGFACLHLAPASLLPLLLLGGASDALFLCSGGSLLPSLLLHGAWNTAQVLGVALAGRETFV